MAEKKRTKKSATERYLAIPYHILNLSGIGLCQKVLLAHIYSFGVKGCYQSNKTLSKVFMVSPYTISRWISDLRGHIYIKSPKGYYRTIWAKSHQQVKEAAKSHYKDKQTSKTDNNSNNDHCKNNKEHRQKCASDCGKSTIRVRQNCGTTNNNTIKEINTETTPLPPLPPKQGASAVLEERKRQMQAQIGQFKKSFGIGPKKPRPRLTEQQFEQRKQKMIKALLSGQRVADSKKPNT